MTEVTQSQATGDTPPLVGNGGSLEGESTQTDKFLTFLLSGEVYGFEVMCIKELIEYTTVTRVPLAPSFIRGVINLRGSVVPIIDLAARLGKDSHEKTRRTCILVLEVHVEGEPVDIGVVVDAVNQVLDLSDNDIEATPPFGSDIRPEFIQAMACVGKQFVYLLNVDRVLALEELADIDVWQA